MAANLSRPQCVNPSWKTTVTTTLYFTISFIQWDEAMPHPVEWHESNSKNDIYIWVRSRNCGCLVTWFCYHLIAKPGNKTATVLWPDPYIYIYIGDHLFIKVTYMSTGGLFLKRHMLLSGSFVPFALTHSSLGKMVNRKYFNFDLKFHWNIGLDNGLAQEQVTNHYLDDLMQERRNSIANTLELLLSCTK